MERLEALRSLYDALERLHGETGPAPFQDLRRAQVPENGVYFFFEPGEERSDSGQGLRVVRVGTHAITATSKASLWGRLKQHRGNNEVAGGNHRGSIFRLLMGDAMKLRNGHAVESWGSGNNAAALVRLSERPLESIVSSYLNTMKVITVNVPDRLERQALETSCIALLSNYRKEPLDAPSSSWLGQYSSREKVRSSGLWNNRDVDAAFNVAVLEILKRSTPLKA